MTDTLPLVSWSSSQTVCGSRRLPVAGLSSHLDVVFARDRRNPLLATVDNVVAETLRVFIREVRACFRLLSAVCPTTLSSPCSSCIGIQSGISRNWEVYVFPLTEIDQPFSRIWASNMKSSVLLMTASILCPVKSETKVFFVS